MFEKRDNFFQLISTLFCEVKRGFVDPRKIVPFEVNYLVQGGDQPIFLQGVLSQKYL
jgi:hypothetical protein